MRGLWVAKTISWREQAGYFSRIGRTQLGNMLREAIPVEAKRQQQHTKTVASFSTWCRWCAEKAKPGWAWRHHAFRKYWGNDAKSVCLLYGLR